MLTPLSIPTTDLLYLLLVGLPYLRRPHHPDQSKRDARQLQLLTLSLHHHHHHHHHNGGGGSIQKRKGGLHHPWRTWTKTQRTFGGSFLLTLYMWWWVWMDCCKHIEGALNYFQSWKKMGDAVSPRQTCRAHLMMFCWASEQVGAALTTSWTMLLPLRAFHQRAKNWTKWIPLQPFLLWDWTNVFSNSARLKSSLF